MRKIVLVGLVTLLFIGNLTLISYAETRIIKVSIDSLPGEADIEDNEREMQVNVVEQGFTDLAITDISVSPSFIIIESTLTATVVVKNKGSYTATNIDVTLYRTGVTCEGEIETVLIGESNVLQILPGEIVTKDFPMPTDELMCNETNIWFEAELEGLENDIGPENNIHRKEFTIEMDEDGRLKILHKANPVHQYICQEAAKIFGDEYFGRIRGGTGAEEMNYLFDGKYWAGEDEGDTINGGVYDEDYADHIYHIKIWLALVNPLFALLPATRWAHFWNPDEGDWRAEGAHGLIFSVVPNTLEKAINFWEGWGFGLTPKPNGGVVKRYTSNDKANAYERLGHVAHLLQDAGVPSHGDPHGTGHAIHDDSFERWIAKDTNYDDWWVEGNKIKHRRWWDGVTETIVEGNLLVDIPWDRKPSDIAEDIFPLYYLMYTSAQTADYFASDHDPFSLNEDVCGPHDGRAGNHGNICDPRGFMDGYPGFPSRPVTEEQLEDNDCTIPCFGTLCCGGNNNDDCDLTRVADKGIPTAS